MVYEGIIYWLDAIPITELAIYNTLQYSTGLSPAYILYDSKDVFGYIGLGLGQCCWCLKGLIDTAELGSGI